LRDIEAGKYTSHQFVAELEEQLRNIVMSERYTSEFYREIAK